MAITKTAVKDARIVDLLVNAATAKILVLATVSPAENQQRAKR
jgi:hypothetical protein